MKKQITIFIFWALSLSGLMAQNDYPIRIDPNTTKQVTAGENPLWIITGTQMDSAVATGMAYRICDSTNTLLKLKISKLEQKTIHLNAINDTLNKGYEHYVSMWKTCDADLEKTEKNLVRQKRLKYIFGGSGFVAGLVLALLLF